MRKTHVNFSHIPSAIAVSIVVIALLATLLLGCSRNDSAAPQSQPDTTGPSSTLADGDEQSPALPASVLETEIHAVQAGNRPSPAPPPFPVQGAQVATLAVRHGASQAHSSPLGVSPGPPRDVSGFGLFSVPLGAAYLDYGDSPSVEDVLARGLFAAGVTPSHIVVRGTPNEDSVRCSWRGRAMTLAQRENAVRFWLGLDDADPLPSVSALEHEFMSHIGQMAPRYRDAMKARYVRLAQGGGVLRSVVPHLPCGLHGQ